MFILFYSCAFIRQKEKTQRALVFATEVLLQVWNRKAHLKMASVAILALGVRFPISYLKQTLSRGHSCWRHLLLQLEGAPQYQGCAVRLLI